jgi:transcriptional regulator with XRE-family HTH domain
MTTFGEFVREKRLAQNLSLREFCELLSFDPSNWSKVEREMLKLGKGSADWHRLFDLASLSIKKIPEDVYSDEEVLEVLPVFFRTVRGDKPTPEELDKLIQLLKTR